MNVVLITGCNYSRLFITGSSGEAQTQAEAAINAGRKVYYVEMKVTLKEMWEWKWSVCSRKVGEGASSCLVCFVLRGSRLRLPAADALMRAACDAALRRRGNSRDTRS